MLKNILHAAEAMLRLAKVSPDSSPVMRWTSASPDHVSIDAEEGLWRYKLADVDALCATLREHYPARTQEPRPKTWGSTPANNQHMAELIAHALVYITDHPEQDLVFTLTPESMSMSTTGRAAACSVIILPDTAEEHLTACERTHDNAFSYLRHSI